MLIKNLIISTEIGAAPEMQARALPKPKSGLSLLKTKRLARTY